MVDYSNYTDVDLTGLLKAGDQYAFAEIYNRYKFILHNHAWNKLKNREEARDLIQEVFSMLWDKRETLQIGHNLPGYLYSCVHNQFLNKVVHQSVKNKYIDSIRDYAQSGTIHTDHRVRESMLKAIIDKEIEALPPRMKQVFILSRQKHLSHREIAELMGTTEQTVKKQMVYALKILRKKLGVVFYLISCFY